MSRESTGRRRRFGSSRTGISYLATRPFPKPWRKTETRYYACRFTTPHRDYLDSIKPHVDRLEEWVKTYGIKVLIYLSYTNWTRRYEGFGPKMEPFQDDDIRKSWERCPAKLCRQLFERKIWKCSPLAYLQLQARRYDLAQAWDPYVAYRPLSPDCSDAELAEFFRREEEPYCAMCPAEPEKIPLQDPRRSHSRLDAPAADARHPVLQQLHRIKQHEQTYAVRA